MLHRLLRPRSIAVIGGGFWCANVVEQCAKIGFAGDVWRVHPTLDGAFRSVDELPGAPDAAFLGVNREATVEVVRALAERGAGGAVCFAAGFREAVAELGDGADKQAALLEAAGEMPVLGPNCYGFINYLDGVALWPDQHGGVRVERGVALVTQSSNIAINLTMQARGLPVAYVVTVGNQAQVGISAISEALLRDERVTALGLHIEGIDDLRAFEALAATAHDLGKPVVALKVGASDQARVATVSHTASLAGSAAGAEALLRRLGIGQARSLPVFLETLKLLHVAGPLASNRVVSMSCSGGEASLMADSALGSGVEFPALVEEQAGPLREALGPKVALANPLDYNTYIWGDLAKMTATYAAMMRADVSLGCVVVDFPRADRCDASAWEPVITAVAAAQAESGRPMALLATFPETMPEAVADRLVGIGIVPFCGVDEAFAAISIAAGMRAPAREPLFLPPAGGDGVTLLEAEAKAVLAESGVKVPVSGRADCIKAAVEQAERIGFPVVLKGVGL
ncbi:MAG: CoA-binding protein, partial [Pseudomonadota bacterium]